MINGFINQEKDDFTLNFLLKSTNTDLFVTKSIEQLLKGSYLEISKDMVYQKN